MADQQTSLDAASNAGQETQTGQPVPSPRGWFALAAVAQWLILVAGSVVIFHSTAYLIPGYGILSFGISLFVAFALYWLAVGVHELGHAVAARWQGMTVVQFYWRPLDILFLKRGFRWRFARDPARRLGFVFPIAAPGSETRAGRVWMLLGGALANFVMAGICGLLAWQLDAVVMVIGAVAFGAANITLGILALVPANPVVPSDGLQLLWILRQQKDALDNPIQQCIQLSVAGTTADQLSPELLDSVRSQGRPGQLLALYLQVKAAQLRGDWPAAAAEADTWTRLEAELMPAEKVAFRRLAALLKRELAFVRAFHDRDAHFHRLLPRDPDLAWVCPHIDTRCQALVAALQGDEVATERHLEATRKLADNSLERAVPASEARLADYIRALPRAATA